MVKKQIVLDILEDLEKNHINLYHSVTKEKVLAWIDKNITAKTDKLSEPEFEAKLCEFFALFRDAHTQYFWHKYNKFPICFKKFNKEFFVIDAFDKKLVGKKLFAINDVSVEKIVKKLNKMVSYEKIIKRDKIVEVRLSFLYLYEMLGIRKSGENHVTYNLDNIDYIFNLDKIAKQAEEYFNGRNEPNYSFLINKNYLYIKYFSCWEMKNYSIINFVNDFENAYNKKEPQNLIFDLRDNDGGNTRYNDLILESINNLKFNKVFCLINEGCFSSGRWVVAKLKKDYNAILIGTEVASPEVCYGYRFKTSHGEYKYSVSKKVIDMYKRFRITKPLKPDIHVERPLSDYIEGKDTQLEMVLKLIENQ